jgi:hypothetical protein
MEYDVLAVIGMEAQTLHVELAGTVPDGTRTDSETGMPVKIIGRIWATNPTVALGKALLTYQP